MKSTNGNRHLTSRPPPSLLIETATRFKDIDPAAWIVAYGTYVAEHFNELRSQPMLDLLSI